MQVHFWLFKLILEKGFCPSNGIFRLSRIRKPVLVQKFADQEIAEGDKLELQIKYLGSKPVTVTWYRDDEVIEADDHCKLLSDDDIHVLRVDPVVVDDEAIYKCVVKNQAGQDQCEAEILVEGISNLTLLSPRES